MAAKHVCDASEICRHSLAFLTEELGYQFAGVTFADKGFTQRYIGPGVGVMVDWHPREPRTAHVVRLVDQEFPLRTEIRPDARLHYFELGDLVEVSGLEAGEEDESLYELPNEETCGLLGGAPARGRAHGSLRRPVKFDEFERLVKRRVRDGITEDYGPEFARELGW